jgi:hypothetical protein
MWLKRDVTNCEECGISMKEFYPPLEDRSELYLCSECTALVNKNEWIEI